MSLIVYDILFYGMLLIAGLAGLYGIDIVRGNPTYKQRIKASAFIIVFMLLSMSAMLVSEMKFNAKIDRLPSPIREHLKSTPPPPWSRSP